MFAKTYTPDEAIAIAHRLRDVKILSDKGENALIKRIGESKEGVTEMSDFGAGWYPMIADQIDGLHRVGMVDPNTGKFPLYVELSDATILSFLARCFAVDFEFRNGTIESAPIWDKFEKKRTQLKSDDEINVNFTEMNETVRAAWPSFQGPQIERAIEVEDSVLNGRGYVTYPGLFGAGGTGKDFGYIDKSRSVVGKTRSRTVRDLQEIGLLDSTVAGQLLPSINQGALGNEAEVLAKAAELTAFRADYPINKEHELKFAQHLMDAGIMSRRGYDSLVASYKPYELKDKFELLSYCDRTLVFETRDLPYEPVAFNDTVYKKIQERLIPSLHYSGLKTTVIVDSSDLRNDLIERRLKVQFTANEALYEHVVFCDIVGGRPENQHKNYPIGPGMTKAINKWMTQHSSPYRLYYASQRDSNGVYGNVRFGLLLMTQAQFQAWGSGVQDYFIFEESHDTSFTPRSVAGHIRLYDSLGLFNHLSKEEKQQGIAKAKQIEIASYAALLACFPKSIVVFDWETGNLSNPYEEHLNEFAAASRGAYTLSKIKDDFEKNLDKSPTTGLSFELNGKKYSASLKMEGDWLDPDFLDLLQKAMQENSVKGKWYYCLYNGQEAGYIFLNDEQYNVLKKKQPGFILDNAGQ